jgi:hypothetical protein
MSFNPDQINSLSKLFLRAEQSVKDAEYIDNGITIPSINELRYFGYHILIAMQQQDNEEEVRREFQKAEGHEREPFMMLPKLLFCSF